MLRTLVLVWNDDIKLSLTECLKKVANHLDVVGVASSVAEGVILYKDLNPDLVVISERMEDGSGMSFLELIRQDSCERIFLCSTEDSRLEALVHGAVAGRDDSPEISKAIMQIMNRRNNSINDRCNQYFHSLNVTSLEKIALPAQDELLWIAPSQILKVTKAGKRSAVSLVDRSFNVRWSLNRMANLLKPSGFFFNEARELVPVATKP
jgi:DNA-binding NarL/FixJ family response regulator